MIEIAEIVDMQVIGKVKKETQGRVIVDKEGK